MAKSVMDVALANLNAQIHDLERAKEIILAASRDAASTEPEPKAKRRGRPRKAGLPEAAPTA